MNKKFSTLVGGLALLGSLTAGAQGLDYSQLKADFAKATKVTKLPASGNGLYQLGNDNITGTYADSVVYMSDEGVLQFVPTPTTVDSLANTLWCISIADEQQAQNPKFNFMNRGTGQRLDITMTGLEGLDELTLSKDSMIAGGEVFGWAFSSVYKDALEQEKPLYSRFSTANGDSIVGLGVKPGGRGLYAVKTAANKVDQALAQGLFQKFTIRTAAEIVLNAKQINTKLGMQEENVGVNLGFTPTVTKNNPFSDKNNKFFAQQVTTQSSAGDSLNYVYVVKADSSFLRVDTAYANTTGHGYLAYAWTDLSKDKLNGNASAPDSLMKSELKAQHQFLFTYKPSEDSVKIYVNRATFGTKEDMTMRWKTDTVHYANAHVFAQDLLDGVKVLTIDSLKQNVKISLGYTGCGEIESNKTTVPNGLYIIKNAKGQVLAAPIHKNGTIEWVTLDAQEPRHMPAYQWVILQNQEALPNSSTLNVINREFAANNVSSVQLTKNGDGNIVTTGVGIAALNGVALTFDKIGGNPNIIEADSAIIKDERLGYKYIANADLDVTKFKFNYLHAFNHDKWIGLSGSSDSVLYVQDDYSAFTFKAGRDSSYGIEVTANILKKIPGLAQLKRAPYIVMNSNKYLLEAAESKYAVGTIATPDTFYFKENNHYAEKDYYAIVKSNTIYSGFTIDTKKVGIADDGVTTPLKVQDLAETRTSAFTVEEIDAPLYRRFSYDEGKDKSDSRDTMRFVEKYRKEVLQIEGNPSFKVKGVDFLGIYKESDAPSGLSFIVDTAWVRRDLGYIKPQYLISIERDDIKGTPGKVCPEAGPHVDKDGNITDAEHCVHATPATPDMNYGKYLVNFADSVTLAKKIGTTGKGYNWGEYNRAGFVKAIQYGDSLYILKDQFASVEKKDINKALLEKIIKANATAAGKAGYIVNLTTDKHKYATWSMRFVQPGTTDRSFLMESMKDANKHDGKDQEDIAPEFAAWLKMQNGCLVLSNSNTSQFSNAKTGGDDALIFDIQRIADDEIATKNESVSTSTVSVVAGEGVVAIKGAAGKTVTISNVLGQTIANTVLSSDNAEVAAPAGVVVVSVEGEAAVKAIVK